MTNNRLSFLCLPHLVHARIAPYLDRESFNALSETNKSLRIFLRSNNKLFDKWPRLNNLFKQDDRHEIVHLVKSPNNKKLCAVIREYEKPGTLIVFDIKLGLISKHTVNGNFQPAFSPNSDVIIAGLPDNDGRGLLIGRILTPPRTRASVREGREIISWYKCFNQYDIRGASFINQETVWVSHVSRVGADELSPQHVYSFTISNKPPNVHGMIISELHASSFIVPGNNQRRYFDINVDVVHKHPYTAINVNCTWELSSKVVLCKHLLCGSRFEFSTIALSPRLDLQAGLGVSLTFSSRSNSLIGVGYDSSDCDGRLITFFDESTGHDFKQGPYQNFSEDFNYYTPKVWYYDGNIIVYSKTMHASYADQHDPDETLLTSEEKSQLEWDEMSLSPPSAFYIRGKVSDEIKRRMDETQTNVTYAISNYLDECKLTPFLQGWTPVMWNLILNGEIYTKHTSLSEN